MLAAMRSPEVSIKPLMYHYMLYINALVTLSTFLNVIVWDLCQNYMELICNQATDVLDFICFKIYNASLTSLKFTKT